jgi:DNA-binding SARP family transcriptional activator/tetratricopeptide (TPR) repeat protein
VQFRILGPVEIETDGRILPLARRQERCLLGILLLDPGRVVAAERLCVLLWDDHPPEQSRAILRSHVARVRAALADAGAATHGVALEFQQRGYVLHAPPESIDAHRFRRLLAQADRTGDPGAREALLSQALGLWRGPALAGAATELLRSRLCADLEELRLHATEESVAVRLALGRHRELLAELADLTATHPARERLAELHMRALYAAGRTEDALAVYADLRTRLATRLGLDPGPAVQRLQRIILRREPLDAPAAVPAPPRPAQLPLDLAGFTGRDAELRQLDDLLGTRSVVAAVTGTAGVGKTTLAVHWAHRVRHHFPDGQLYVNLRGFDPSGAAVTPTEALLGFLEALGVAAAQRPSTVDAQIGLYRSLLAGKRMLLLLDNASDPEQVRPLLPADPGCLAVVTSRNQLTGLVAIEGAQRLRLDLLTAHEAGRLLAARLGAARVDAEPDAARALTELCARLPLALAVAAAQAAAEPEVPLATVVTRLRATRTALDAVTGDDTATNIRSVFAHSYQTLSPPAANLFRLFGLHPGPDVSAAAAASLAGVPPHEVGPLLGELTRAHLVAEPTPGRYTSHDLLRAYARELAETVDPAGERDAAILRLLDHYVHTAYAANLLDPHREPIRIEPASAGVTPERFTDFTEATAWLGTEHQVLLGAVRLAEQTDLNRHTWQLAWALANFLYRHGYWHDFVTVQEAALAAARRTGDGVGESAAHRFLAHALTRLGRHEEAYAHLQRSLVIHERIDDPNGLGHTHGTIAEVWYERQGRYREALHHAELALEQHLLAGNESGQAESLDQVGRYHSQLGDHEQALVHCRNALLLLRKVGNSQGEAATLDSLGHAHHHLGESQEAIACYRKSVELFRDLGDRYNEADVLTHLGEVHRDTGEMGAARDCWQRALTIFDQLEHPNAQTVRDLLSRL